MLIKTGVVAMIEPATPLATIFAELISPLARCNAQSIGDAIDHRVDVLVKILQLKTRICSKAYFDATGFVDAADQRTVGVNQDNMDRIDFTLQAIEGQFELGVGLFLHLLRQMISCVRIESCILAPS